MKNQLTIWKILSLLFLVLGIFGILFVFVISYYFYRFNISHEIEERSVFLELTSNSIAGPSWTVANAYPGTVENILNGALKIEGAKFIRIVNDDGSVSKSSDIKEEDSILDDLPVFGRTVIVRDGVYKNENIKEFSIQARDGTNIWMGVSFREIKKRILNSAAQMGQITLILLIVVMLVTFSIIQLVILKPLRIITDAFDQLKEKNYIIRLKGAHIAEMEKVYDSFNEMVQRVREADEQMAEEMKRTKEIDRMKSEFISVAAHQLRTPLSAIKWTLKMLIDGDIGALNPEQKTYLTQGYISNERIIKLVNDLLNVARIEEGRFGYIFSHIHIEDLIDGIVFDLEHTIKEKKIKFQFNRTDNASRPLVYLDPSKIRLVVQNLLDNAVKYTPEGGEVTINVKYSKIYLEIEVVDTGIGIPEDQKKKLFSKFFRASNAVKKQTEGTGLGMFIVKNIVEKHGGRIELESQENKGTRVKISIPLNAPMQKENM